jgi:hypothetical protein
MEPTIDSIITLSHPLIYPTNISGMQLNQQFANTDFPDRHLTLKKPQIKVVATEESLDDWHAQSLGISTDKLIKAKKYLQNFQKDKKDRPKEPTRDTG